MTKYACGKCRSTALHRDDDEANGHVFIACIMCGNRWPGGPAPIIVGCVSTHQKPKEEPMIKICKNCNRTKSIVKGGLCYVCNNAGKGKTGEERTAALAEIKRKIENGEVKAWNKRSKEKPAPVVKAALENGTARRRGRQPGNRNKTARPLPVDRNTPEPGKAGLALGSAPMTPDVGLLSSTIDPPAPPADPPAIHRPAIDEVTDFSASRTVIPVTGGVDCIVLEFTADDRALRDRILELAKRYRRDPGQQALWMVQQEIANGK